MICECYRAEKNFLGKVGLCWGTAERDACSCGGNKSKCDFYPNVREEGKKPINNADRIRSMSDEELAKWIRDQIIDRNIGIPSETWLDWLRQEVDT